MLSLINKFYVKASEPKPELPSPGALYLLQLLSFPRLKNLLFENQSCTRSPLGTGVNVGKILGHRGAMKFQLHRVRYFL